MTWGEFSKLTLLPNKAGLQVTGPYNPDITGGQKVLGDVFIGFLIIQQDDQNHPSIIVDGVAIWSYAPPDEHGKYRDWSTIVPWEKLENAGGQDVPLRLDKVRAIGTAVQVTDYMPSDPRVPPGVATFTWCVDQEIVDS